MQYPDIDLAGVDPWDHFLLTGLDEGRKPTPLFQPEFFTNKTQWERYSDVSIIDYLSGLHREMPPSPIFDVEWYLSQANVETAAESVLEHYIREGADNGVEPCPLFVSSEFPRSRFDVTPLEEYLSDSKHESSIGCFFSRSQYLKKSPELANTRMDPLVHFYASGQDLNRYQHPLIDLHLSRKLLPEATTYSDLVAALRSERAISPEELSDDPLSQQVLRHVIEVDGVHRTALIATKDTGNANGSISEELLMHRAATIELPEVGEPAVSVIIPTFNDSAMTIRSVEAVSRSSCLSNLEIVVVDDGSQPETVTALSHIKNINLIRLKKNGGYSSAVSAGVSAASGKYIFLHNNDAEVLPPTLQTLVDTLDDDDTIGAAGCLVLDKELNIQEAGCALSVGGFGHQFGNGSTSTTSIYRYSRDVDYCSAVALILRKSTWHEVGGYSKSLEPAYYEDADLCMKIAATGKRIRYVANAVVLHSEGSSHGRGLHGSKAFQFRNRRIFANVWSSALAFKPAITDDMSRMQYAHAYDLQPGDDVLVVDDKCPDITTDAGSVRMAQIATALADEGLNVHFVGLGGERRSAWSRASKQSSIHWETGWEGLRKAIRMLRTESPLVILSRPDVYTAALPVLVEEIPGAYVVFDTVDAHGLRLDREIETLKSDGKSTQDTQRRARGTKRLEALAINSADCVISLSPTDSAYFRTINKDVPIVEIPMIHSPVEHLPGSEGRGDVLFVGGYRHTPNIDAALFAANEIMPEVWKEFPTARLMLAGSFPPKQVRELASQRIVVPGWLDSLDDLYLSARVVLAPLRFGAGINGKVTEALSLGIPVVTSALSAKAADLIDEREVLIANTAESYAESIVRLFREDALWYSLSTAGVEKVTQRFSPQVARAALRTLESLRNQ